MRDDPNACMIFAAGFGTRMAPLTDTCPKPLLQVAGRSLLRHALDPAKQAGLSPIVVNAHYLAEQIVDAMRDEPVTVIKEKDLLDTGGGLKNALPHLGTDPVFTMNSDAVWSGPNPYETLRNAWKTQLDALLLCVPCERAVGRVDGGDFDVCADGRISRGSAYVYTGAQIIRPAIVSARSETVFSFNLIWDALFDSGRGRAVIFDGQWCDVGRPASIPLAERMLDV